MKKTEKDNEQREHDIKRTFGYVTIEDDGLTFDVCLKRIEIANDLLESRDRNLLILHVGDSDKGVAAIAKYLLYGDRSGYTCMKVNTESQFHTVISFG